MRFEWISSPLVSDAMSTFYLLLYSIVSELFRLSLKFSFGNKADGLSGRHLHYSQKTVTWMLASNNILMSATAQLGCKSTGRSGVWAQSLPYCRGFSLRSYVSSGIQKFSQNLGSTSKYQMLKLWHEGSFHIVDPQMLGITVQYLCISGILFSISIKFHGYFFFLFDQANSLKAMI